MKQGRAGNAFHERAVQAVEKHTEGTATFLSPMHGFIPFRRNASGVPPAGRRRNAVGTLPEQLFRAGVIGTHQKKFLPAEEVTR